VYNVTFIERERKKLCKKPYLFNLCQLIVGVDCPRSHEDFVSERDS